MAEEASYKVLEALGDGVEIRRYPKRVCAHVASRIEADAFTKLLAYISGRNALEETIPMTAPVFSRQDPTGTHMAFVMPEGRTVKDLPEPVSRDIGIKEVDERDLAVVSFTGYLTSESFGRNCAILKNKLNIKDMKTSGEAYLLQYDQPHVPPLERRNEIALEVE